MSIRDYFNLFWFGSSFDDMKMYDSLLRLLLSEPRSYAQSIEKTHLMTSAKLEICLNFFIKEGLVVENDLLISITPLGVIHLAEGGYLKKVETVRRNRFSFWLSIGAFIMSIIALFFKVVITRG